MKKIKLLVLLLGCLYLAKAEWKPLGAENPVAPEIKLISQSEKETVVSISILGYIQTPVTTQQGKAAIISLIKGSPIMEDGCPDLPKITTSLIVPDADEMQLSVLNSDYIELKDIEIAPSKGNLLRTVDPSTVPYTYGNVYQTNTFYPENIAYLREPYIIRDYRGQTVVFQPFQYNPITKTLKVHTKLTVKISSTGKLGENVLERKNAVKPMAEFAEIYKRQFINFQSSKYTPVAEAGNMLIICHGPFMNAMQSLVEWKNKSGIPCEIVNVSTIGLNSTAIKNYIINYNATKTLGYVLLVGDAAQVPTYVASSGDSDNSYSYILGTDHYPDLFVGRFSAETEAHVITQVQRTIRYEMANFPSDNWLNKGVCIASSEGPGDDNEYDWQHQRNIRTDLLGFTYGNVSELYDGSQGGADAAGNPTATMVATEVNNGAGVITYTGHGSETSFVTTGFSNSNIANLTNENRLPFIWSVACVNGNFVNNTCFAEAWLRATKNGNPTGAVATLMSTINQSWNPPMCGQDEMIDIFVESYSNNIKRTFGGISMNGCMQMNDEFGVQGSDMTDTWNLFGDPSLMVRSNNPATMTVSQPGNVLQGSTQFVVNCSAEGALATLSLNNEIFSTAIVSGGIANFSFAPITIIDTFDLVITAFNYIPYIGTVAVIPPDGPYIIYKSSTINDIAGNNNGLADFGESVLLNVMLENIGIDPADSVFATLSTTDPYINIINDNKVWGDIANGTTSLANDAFLFNIADNIPNNRLVSFGLAIGDNNGHNWTGNFNIRMYAPQLAIGTATINDAAGNNNGLADAGENILFETSAKNIGAATAVDAYVLISTTSPYLTITEDSVYLGSIIPADSAEFDLHILIDSNTPLETYADVSFTIVTGNYSFSQTKTIIIGYLPNYLMSNATITACAGRFYDSGGPTANYGTGETKIMTFLPSVSGNQLQFNFSSFNVELNWDYLYIYNGTSTSSPQIAGSPFTGTNSPGTILATNPQGAFTFKFTSDTYIETDGWEAEFSCVNINNPPACATNLVPADGAVNVDRNIPLTWNAVSGAFSYDIYFGTILPSTPTQNVTTNSYLPVMATNTTYYWKVVPKNNAGEAIGCIEQSFTTGNQPLAINMTNGTFTVQDALFYDSGGANSNYQNDESYILTFMPASRAGKIKVVFSAFQVETNYDYLYAYDGTSTSAPQFVGSPYHGTTLPGTAGQLQATNASGAITFKFTSDYMINQTGWAAVVSVVGGTVEASQNELSAMDIIVAPNPSENYFNISFSKDIEDCEIKLLDLKGLPVIQESWKKLMAGDLKQIDIAHLPAGMYILKLSNKHFVVQQKISKIR